MKINDTQRIGAYRAYQPAAETRTNSSSAKRSKDEVKFSAEAMELLSARKGAAETDRTQRIEQLKDEISTGTYQVPDHLLADKLLPFVR
jgi:negative regulator of flagellin synthesis FlgM